MATQDYIRPQDMAVFRKAAKFHKVWILVRRTNRASLQYIGVPGYTPKRLECKAKTADLDLHLPKLGVKRTAGLVVNPTLPGFEAAFRKPGKHQQSVSEWRKFAQSVFVPEAGKKVLWMAPKQYSVQMDPAHPHYGCLWYSSCSSAVKGEYIHADYDLYAVVPEQDPASNVRVAEKRMEFEHFRGREFMDVQNFVNHGIGAPMIRHGEQEKEGEREDDLDVFWPDGVTVTEALGIEAIRGLYETVFRGRKAWTRGDAGQKTTGLWRKSP